MKIPYGRQSISDKDIEAVVKVLKSDFLTQGPKVPEFEDKVLSAVGAKKAVAVNSATSALHLACLALGLKSGDILWTCPISFVASANCALYCGASVDFIDIDPSTLNISTVELEKKLKFAELEGKLPKILVAVHFSGNPCDMREINILAKRYNFYVIEDASHAVGAKYNDEYVGNCRYSDITVFSFHPVKIITSAEGGMALTNSNFLADKMKLLRSHGITRDQSLMENASRKKWYYEQVDLGFNYRMTDLQAALGISQWDQLENFINDRHVLSDQYDKLLSNLPIIRPQKLLDRKSSIHLYVIRLQRSSSQATQEKVFNALTDRGIFVNVHYIPIHTQPYFKRQGFNLGDFPKSESYYNEAISLPIFPGLTHEEQIYISKELETVLLNG